MAKLCGRAARGARAWTGPDSLSSRAFGGNGDRQTDIEVIKRQRGPAAEQDWARGLAALLKDRQSLDEALADPSRFPRVPPGMPIGMDGDE